MAPSQRGLLVLLALVACRASPAPSSRKATGPDFGPPVDKACLEQVLAGMVVSSAPAEVGGFTVAPRDKTGVYLRRAGRKLDEREGQALWDTFTGTYMQRARFSTGSSAMSSVDKCADVGDTACLSFDVWVCQSDLATIASLVSEAAAQIGAADGELGIRLRFIETASAPCRGARCVPETHYSRKEKYDPSRGRTRSAEGGQGRCDTDAECRGADSHYCTAWYLRGGVETCEFRQLGRPTFCGCMDHACTWFTQ